MGYRPVWWSVTVVNCVSKQIFIDNKLAITSIVYAADYKVVHVTNI